MAEITEDILEAVGYVLIVLLVLISIAIAILPKEFTGTSAGAFSAATVLSYSISGLSLADQGSITRDLNGTYDVEIGLESDSGQALKNYYAIVTPYTADGRKMNPTEKFVFVGNVKVGDKLKIERVNYVKLAKSYGNPVEIVQVSQTIFTGTFCSEPPAEQIKQYVIKYTASDDERKWIKAIIMAESRYTQCVGSAAGAFGLMQLMDATARGVGVSNRFDAEQNIKGGTEYYRSLVNRYRKYDDKNVLAAAAYNCGKIATLVALNCESNGIYTGCWEKAIKNLAEKSECQGAGGKETYTYIIRVQKCVAYYGQNPGCYNAPGKSGDCPPSSECGNW